MRAARRDEGPEATTSESVRVSSESVRVGPGKTPEDGGRLRDERGKEGREATTSESAEATTLSGRGGEV